MSCRICGSTRVINRGPVDFYVDFCTPVFDCGECGCRYTTCDPALYEQFHATRTHYYVRQMQEWTETAKVLFRKRDQPGLLRALERFHFLAPQIARSIEASGSRSVLEVGCAWGYNSSYFLLRGFDFLGVDISPTAVEQARAAFGDYFCTVDDPRYVGHEPFDAIFHLGTVGCVDKPIEFIHTLLDRLKPGGLLTFNAPSRRFCDQLNTPWVWGACPPDLVTLFSDSFWGEQFSQRALVTVTTRELDDLTSWRWRWLRWCGRNQPNRGSLFKPITYTVPGALHWKSQMRDWLRTTVCKVRLPGLPRLAHPFGVLVSMEKRN